MQDNKRTNLLAAIVVAAIALSTYLIQAKPAAAGDNPSSRESVQIIQAASNLDPLQLLPDRLSNTPASGTFNRYTRDQLSELVGKEAEAYGEYGAAAAYAREYGNARVEVFQTEGLSAAYGLFTYSTADPSSKPEAAIGWGSSEADGKILFWKKNYVVAVSTNRGRVSPEARKLASSVASLLGDGAPILPLVVSNFPASAGSTASVRYFLGPIALSKYVEHAKEQFSFDGHAEAVLGQYPKEAGSPSTANLLIIEYHTPQFAYDAMKRAGDFLSTLPEEERDRTILKREGNYLVESTNVRDREGAERLVSLVQYPYQVKWLRNPLWRTNDPFGTQKAADMLLSTFGVIGLLILTVLIGGGSFGAFVFMRRRRRLREVFTDAGGMLHLDIEPAFTRPNTIGGDFRLKLSPPNNEDR